MCACGCGRWRRGVRHVIEAAKGLSVPKGQLAGFHHFDPVRTLADTAEALEHYLMLLRDLVFEEGAEAAVPRPPLPRHLRLARALFPALAGLLDEGAAAGRAAGVRADGDRHRLDRQPLAAAPADVVAGGAE